MKNLFQKAETDTYATDIEGFFINSIRANIFFLRQTIGSSSFLK